MVKLAIGKLKNIPSSLTSLKSKVDKFHIGKLENKPVDLSKLCNVIKNMMLLKRLNIIYLKKLIISAPLIFFGKILATIFGKSK